MDFILFSHIPSAYPQIKALHLVLVTLSGLLFVARGIGVLAQQSWPMWPTTKKCSVGIDVLLLCAGGCLWTILHLNPVRDTWLGVKLALLLLYIAVGSVALRRGRAPTIRRWAFGVAICIYATMVGVAWTHHPLSFFARWLQT